MGGWVRDAEVVGPRARLVALGGRLLGTLSLRSGFAFGAVGRLRDAELVGPVARLVALGGRLLGTLNLRSGFAFGAVGRVRDAELVGPRARLVALDRRLLGTLSSRSGFAWVLDCRCVQRTDRLFPDLAHLRHMASWPSRGLG